MRKDIDNGMAFLTKITIAFFERAIGVWRVVTLTRCESVLFEDAMNNGWYRSRWFAQNVNLSRVWNRVNTAEELNGTRLVGFRHWRWLVMPGALPTWIRLPNRGNSEENSSFDEWMITDVKWKCHNRANPASIRLFHVMKSVVPTVKYQRLFLSLFLYPSSLCTKYRLFVLSKAQRITRLDRRKKHLAYADEDVDNETKAMKICVVTNAY